MNNIMQTEDLRKLQLIELDLLLELDRICRKHNIEYVISAGTALGAVRHKGFIPWDDDLDTQMTREEFEKFEKVCNTELNHDKYFLQTADSDPEYRWGYAKLRRKNTLYLRKGQEAIKCMSGVSIDIFIMDNSASSNIGIKLQYYIRRGCIKTLWSVVGVTEDPTPWKRRLYSVLRYVPKQIPLGIIKYMGKSNNRKNSDYRLCLSFYRRNSFLRGNAKDRERLNKWFDERVEIEFEGFKFYIRKDYYEYLTNKYKNIWEYPPENERTLHKPKSYMFDVDIDLRGKDINELMNKEYIYLKEEDIVKREAE